MKKIVALLFSLLFVCTAAHADDDRSIQFNQLPAKAQEWVKQHFPTEKVALAKKDTDLFDKTYEVIFVSSIKVEFNKDGSWKEVNCQYSAVPEAIIPPAIIRYVKTNYPDQQVVKIEKDTRDYEVKLSGGLQLKFDKKFNLIDIDN